jgi:hypothetical protein
MIIFVIVVIYQNESIFYNFGEAVIYIIVSFYFIISIYIIIIFFITRDQVGITCLLNHNEPIQSYCMYKPTRPNSPVLDIMSLGAIYGDDILLTH